MRLARFLLALILAVCVCAPPAQAADPRLVDFHRRILALEQAPAGSMSGTAILLALAGVDGSGSGLDADLLDGHDAAYFLAATDYTAADVLAKLLTVDGAGSGLDADTLDGSHAAAFAQLATANAFTSDQTIGANAGTTRYLNMNAAAGNIRAVRFLTAGSQRWFLYCSQTAESGSNAGSDFALARYADAGTFIDTPLTVTRSTGVASFASRPTHGSSKLVAQADYIDGSAAWDPPSIAGSGNAYVDVTCTGAALGDFVDAAWSASPGNLWLLPAFVVSANTVRVRFYNPTGSAVDLSAGTMYARVTKRGW